MTTIRFLPEAKSELLNTIDYYESKSSGLGLDFSKEVQRALQQISLFPKAWQKLKDKTRRYLLHRFPYIIVYLIHENDLHIISVAHCQRKPNYWSPRMESLKN